MTETAKLLGEVERFFTVVAATEAEATWAQYAQTVVLRQTSEQVGQWAQVTAQVLAQEA